MSKSIAMCGACGGTGKINAIKGIKGKQYMKCPQCGGYSRIISNEKSNSRVVWTVIILILVLGVTGIILYLK